MTGEADAKRDLAEAITAAVRLMGAETEELSAQLRELFGALLTRTQDAGAVPNDVDAADVQAFVVAALTAGRRRGTNDRPHSVRTGHPRCMAAARSTSSGPMLMTRDLSRVALCSAAARVRHHARVRYDGFSSVVRRSVGRTGQRCTV
ncbi:SbtR family transcriptional regulator [Streptomyces sp. SD15]